jgi:hypothetical protein
MVRSQQGESVKDDDPEVDQGLRKVPPLQGFIGDADR